VEWSGVEWSGVEADRFVTVLFFIIYFCIFLFSNKTARTEGRGGIFEIRVGCT
jgi:hypothetical protein